MDWSLLITQATINGLIVGLLYLLMAVGFTLVFGIMRMVNFAHGEFYMLGAFGAYFFTTALHLPFLAAVGLTFAGSIVFGGLLEWLILKPFRRDELNGMIVTIGMAMILQNLALMIFGPDPLSMPAVAEGTLEIAGIVIPNSRVYVVGFAVNVQNDDPGRWIPGRIGDRNKYIRNRGRLARAGRPHNCTMPTHEPVNVDERRNRLRARKTSHPDEVRRIGPTVNTGQILLGDEVSFIADRWIL